tara:strand:- start:628 stop:1083 length:456 start_codon:yes stop_codon:yes gene_type:complete
MPNHCHNRVTISCDQDHIEEFNKVVTILKSDEVFGQIIPEPNWDEIPNENGEFSKMQEMTLANGEVVATCKQWSDGSQDDRWYSWRIAHWGTKWDLYDRDVTEDEEDVFEVTFDTAWSPPEEICASLRSDYPDLHISWFYDEPGMEFAGYL